MKPFQFRICVFVLAFIMLYTIMPFTPAQAASIANPTLVVEDSSGNAPAFVGNQWNLTGGTYTVSGTAQKYEGIKITGDVTLNLDGATIVHEPTKSDLYTLDIENQFIPAISIESGSVNLNLVGESTVKGSPAHAGIYVSTGATLTVSGSGKLTATGGAIHRYRDGRLGVAFKYAAGGAGIGGNGLCQSEKLQVVYQQPNFGKIDIQDGTVVATGGAILDANYGGGAGIGTGGASSMLDISPELDGTVCISGGTVTATGGQNTVSYGSPTGGGAGIGTGGSMGAIFMPYLDASSVIITGGTVNAYGSSDGAGIGSGANVDSNFIEITGGTINAIGGDQGNGEEYGGAGIGSGDNGSVRRIVISGTANVTAQGGGAAAGIGNGNNGNAAQADGKCELVEIGGSAQVVATGGSEQADYKYGGAGIGSGLKGVVGQINIMGDAKVTATGGNGAAGIGGGFNGGVVNGIAIEGATVEARGSSGYEYSSAKYNGFGGAGIGSGVRWNTSLGCGAISITSGATVRAYTEGKETNAIGAGGRYTSKGDNSLKLDDTISLWAQTPDSSRPALLDAGCGPTTYASSGVYLTTNNPTTGKADGYLNQPAAQADAEFAFQLGTDLTIDGNLVAMAAPKDPVGNWATLYKLPAVTVTYQFVGELPDGAALPAPDSVSPGAQFALKQPADVTGWQFDGWYTNAACTDKFAGDAGITGDTVLYGRWNPKSTPVTPKAAVYRVEHVQKQPDGTYKLMDADFPLYGELGKTVTAVPKEYEGFVVNRAASTLSGVVIPPEGDVCLVLTVRYDPISQPSTTPPRTGDSGTPLLWLCLLAVSALGMGGVVASKSKMW